MGLLNKLGIGAGGRASRNVAHHTSGPHRGSAAFDCEENLVYSQRPFQRLRPASTTKALTTLIACEAIQSAEVDSDYVYTVPEWEVMVAQGRRLAHEVRREAVWVYERLPEDEHGAAS